MACRKQPGSAWYVVYMLCEVLKTKNPWSRIAQPDCAAWVCCQFVKRRSNKHVWPQSLTSKWVRVAGCARRRRGHPVAGRGSAWIREEAANASAQTRTVDVTCAAVVFSNSGGVLTVHDVPSASSAGTGAGAGAAPAVGHDDGDDYCGNTTVDEQLHEPA